ncbi:bifunctional deaminase-reductase domain protein [Haloterrigena turkmenica DSM 5511]|uniref:Bifunctional deaminase-reductase domain protein n=1 Tax=Haloterrigena turkmenica (strain ATCC 51198 / DSM 5511 / JCM 9101 / NCIMB 13204 / VKM B-1734 / 4k) TaxID=543526 RepID=D2RU55_HALTV|nr:dihydrofolate reductase family protein [Haloterrigena turkmenica]ADB59124.1 bifunctional deaminase-reductase domain protein [Haloterrigena turkmenica DSM 5511]
MTRGTVTLYIAASLDGFVATADGGVEWLEEYASDGENGADGNFEAFFADVDCLVMGSRTYEQLLSFDGWPYGERPTFVVTSRDLPLATAHVELVAGNLRELVDGLEERYDRIWLVGGAALAQSFLREGLVDEIRLTVVPVLLGGGIRLFDDDGTEHTLETLECTSFESGLVELRYDASRCTPSV